MNWLRELFKSSYTRMLEEENARLRGENRAMINSLLGVAGHSPVDFPAVPEKVEAKGRRNLSLHQQQQKTEADSERRMLLRAQTSERKSMDAA